MAESALSRPMYAVLGASDALGDQLKKFAAHAPQISQQMQARTAELPGELSHRALRLVRDLQFLAVDVPSYAAELYSRTRQLDGAAVTTAVRQNLKTAQSAARGVYGAYAELAKRGERAAGNHARQRVRP